MSIFCDQKMTNKFDPNATPFCDEQKKRPVFLTWEMTARRFEKDKRIAEEKLRIAIKGLKWCANHCKESEPDYVLKDIEQVGKHD